MDWFFNLDQTHPTAHAIIVLCLVCVGGLALGSAKVKGVRLGSAGVLFAGIIASSFVEPPDHVVLDFMKDFGLVLFVFMIGLQLGPGFIDSLRREGLRLNLLAGGVVLLGSCLAVAAGSIFGFGGPATVGLLTGATTNTPSLAAAQQTFAAAAPEATSAPLLTATAYAVAYPAGIAGILLALLIIRFVFRIDPHAEAIAFAAANQVQHDPPERRSIIVENANLDGLRLKELPHISDFGVQVSRLRRAGAATVEAIHGGTLISKGDTLMAVGPRRELDQFERVVGRRVDEDLTAVPGDLVFKQVVVTRKRVIGRALRDLHLGQRFNVKATRLKRADIELAAFGSLRLQFGDVLRLVGDEASIERAAGELGNSVKALNETHFIPIFLGIAIGLLVGMIPLAAPGLPQPVRLGLAGGPLLLAILVSRIGNIGPLVWYIPSSANLAFRELGITLFLACVGLKAGPQFFETVPTPSGVLWLAVALFIATVPLLAVGFVARAGLKMNYTSISGLLSGSMTDPPALAFACGAAKSELPSASYATVYPLTTLLRIITAQVLALWLVHP